MPSYKVRREFLRMEYVVVSAPDEHEALEQAQSKAYDGLWEPFWNQDEDWQYSVEEAKPRES